MYSDDFVVIIQGPIRLGVDFLEKKWYGFPIIWSTWKGENIKTNNIVIYNDEPGKTNGNIAHQQASTLSGIIKAKELGYKRCLKWRSDQYPNNPISLVNTFDKNSINVMYWHDYNGGYYTDYFMEGNVDDLIKIWDFNQFNVPFPEYIITKQIVEHQLNVNCIGDQLTAENNIFWDKGNFKKDLSTYKHDKTFKNKKI